LLSGRISVETIERINAEIDEATYTSSDPDVIVKAVQAGLCGEQTGSKALGFNENEVEKARADHAERIKRIAMSQGIVPAAGSRGVRDLSAGSDEGRREKEASRDTDQNESTETPVRGEGK
jgi:hypothetical protein